MKKIILSAFMILAGVAYTQAGVIVIEGNYQGKNLYIQNPYAGSNVGFCTFWLSKTLLALSDSRFS